LFSIETEEVFQESESGLFNRCLLFCICIYKMKSQHIFYTKIRNMKRRFFSTTAAIICLIAFSIISCKEQDEVNSISVLSSDTINRITQKSAIVNSIITADAGITITSRGVCWSKSQLPTILDIKTTDSSGTGNFESLINGLEANTAYTVRAYASSASGTYYGNLVSFTTLKPFPENGSVVKDIENNTYHTIVIGNQVWLKENLNVTKYRDGGSIIDLTDLNNWSEVNNSYGAYSNYNNDTNLSAIYGKLYNWYAANNSRGICPVGWHVPTQKEWHELIDFLGGNAIAGGSLKENGTTNWYSPNVGGSNISGFTALPSGYRELDGTFQSLGYTTYIWSSTEFYALALGNNENNIGSTFADRSEGFSVRCVMDK
jgi:uncharacterized protein (TIGR02145 family)